MKKVTKILDLFCGAGGAAMGLHMAFPDAKIIGVDINPQKRYPFQFIQGDALTFPIAGFDFVWASPPCQKHSVMTKGRWKDRIQSYANLIPATRKRLMESMVPYTIENVPGAKKELINPIMLCGTMFNLETKYGSQLRRHRLFELHGFHIKSLPACNHKKNASVIGVYGGGQHPQRRRIPATVDVHGHGGGYSKRDDLDYSCFSIKDRRDAMGINWMIGKELVQAIPPAFSEYIGNEYNKSFKKDAAKNRRTS